MVASVRKEVKSQIKSQGTKRLKLQEYPAAIAEEQLILVELNEQIVKYTELTNTCAALITSDVEFNTELKNEKQRNIERNRLLGMDVDYQIYSKALIQVKKDKEIQQVKVEQLKNEFHVAMLLKREEIATRSNQFNF